MNADPAEFAMPLLLVGTLGGASSVAFVAIGMIAALVGAYLFRRRLRTPHREPVDADFDLDVYEAAYLANGAEGAIDAALTHLAGRGMVGVDAKKGTFARADPLIQPYLPLDRLIHEALPRGRPVAKGDLRSSTLLALDYMEAKLRMRGLLLSNSSRDLGQVIPFLAFLAVGLLGLSNLPEESGPNLLWSPKGIVAAFFMTILLVFVLSCCLKPIHRSLLGDRVLDRLQGDSRRLHARAEADLGPMTPLVSTTIAVALFGLSSLPGDDPSRQALEGGTENNFGSGG